MTQEPDWMSIGGWRWRLSSWIGPPGASMTMRHAKNGPASVSSCSIEVIGHFERTPMPPATHVFFGPWNRACGNVPFSTASHSSLVSCRRAMSGEADVIASTPLGSPATPKFMLYVRTRNCGAPAGIGVVGSPPLAQPTTTRSVSARMVLRQRATLKGCCILGLLLTQAVHADQDKRMIRKVVKQHLPKIMGCYEKALNEIATRIVVDFTIDT